VALGGLAQLVEHLLCKQAVRSSSLLSSIPERDYSQVAQWQSRRLLIGWSQVQILPWELVVVAELVDALGLGSSEATREGSSPFSDI
jgi:hypothetical protein